MKTLNLVWKKCTKTRCCDFLDS